MPLCLSLWAMHSAERHQPSCTSCTDANLARAQMSSGWLAGWLAGWLPSRHTLGNVCEVHVTHSRKIHLGISRAAMRLDWQQRHH